MSKLPDNPQILLPGAEGGGRKTVGSEVFRQAQEPFDVRRARRTQQQAKQQQAKRKQGGPKAAYLPNVAAERLGAHGFFEPFEVDELVEIWEALSDYQSLDEVEQLCDLPDLRWRYLEWLQDVVLERMRSSDNWDLNPLRSEDGGFTKEARAHIAEVLRLFTAAVPMNFVVEVPRVTIGELVTLIVSTYREGNMNMLLNQLDGWRDKTRHWHWPVMSPFASASTLAAYQATKQFLVVFMLSQKGEEPLQEMVEGTVLPLTVNGRDEAHARSAALYKLIRFLDISQEEQNRIRFDVVEIQHLDE